jgi:hypothetical protein
MAKNGNTTVPAWLEQAFFNLAKTLGCAIKHNGIRRDWDAETNKLRTMATKAKALRRALGNPAVADRLFIADQVFVSVGPKVLDQSLAIMEHAAGEASRMKRRDGLSPKRLCALMAGTIIETYAEKWPSKKSPDAHKICDALWSMATGKARQLATMDASENSLWWRHLEWASNNRDHNTRLAIVRLIDDALGPDEPIDDPPKPDKPRSARNFGRPTYENRRMPLRPGQPDVKTQK